jgi:hypothetical protein
MEARSLTAYDRFAIFHRDDFTCRFCGFKCPSENLEADHLIPWARMGSDNPENMITACKKCNRGKGDAMLFPSNMTEGTDDDGWTILKSWGIWAIKASGDSVWVTGAIFSKNPKKAFMEYPIEAYRLHDNDMIRHVLRKKWDAPHKDSDFLDCARFACRLIREVF